jgi:hypothetical protein
MTRMVVTPPAGCGTAEKYINSSGTARETDLPHPAMYPVAFGARSSPQRYNDATGSRRRKGNISAAQVSQFHAAPSWRNPAVV